MNKIPVLIGFVISGLCLTNTALAVTWYVHPDSTINTIQAGVDSSSVDDTVLVAAGTYTGVGNRDIDFNGKAIVVISENGADATIIDCEGSASEPHRGFYFHSGESLSSVVQGFTIKNGDAGLGNGGGIDCTLQSSPTIADCVFFANRADALGGGVACRGLSNPAILRCTFEDNVAFGYYEGAQGGGVSCFILSNATIVDCVFINNYSQFGGALDCSGSYPIADNCLFIENTGYLGGAIFCSGSDPTITNCTFTQNSAVAGGALVLAGAYLPSYPLVTNCIMWNDSPNEVEVGIGQPTITYTDIQGGWAGTGNIDSNPLFVTGPHGGFYLSQIAAGQAQQSLCVDAGNPNYPLPDGTTRTDQVPDAPPVDLGYHYPAPTGILENDYRKIAQNPIRCHVFPNPFTHTTSIRFTIPDPGSMLAGVHQKAELEIYDATGRLIKAFDLGSYIMYHGSMINWDGTDQANRQVGSGVYFVTLEFQAYTTTQKVLLIR